MTTTKVNMSDMGNLGMLTGKECIHQLLLSRQSVADNADTAANQTKNAWQSVSPRLTGALAGSLMVTKTSKYSMGLFFDSRENAIKAHSLNKNSAKHRGFETRFLKSQGNKFLGMKIK